VKAGLFPLVWVVSAAKLQPPFSSPALRSLHSRPGRSGSLRSTDLQSPHLANDEAHALHHGCACSESTSVPLRPKARRRKRRALLSAECALIFFYFCQNSSVVCRGLFSCERTQTQERHPRRALCRNRRPEAKLPLLSVGK
jgi:hypothetical protein